MILKTKGVRGIAPAGCGREPAKRRGLDPRTRLLAAGATTATALTLTSPPLLAGSLGLAVTLALLGGLPLRRLITRLIQVEGFLLVLVATLPLTLPGPAALTWGPLTLSWPGLERAGEILLRVSLCAVTLLALLDGLEPVRLGHALARLGTPVRLVHLLLFAARYVGLIRTEAAQLQEALRARAFRPRLSWHALQTLSHLIVALLVRAVDRAERIDEAMRCRGFAGRFALISEDRFSRDDARFALGLGLVLALVVTGDRLR